MSGVTRILSQIESGDPSDAKPWLPLVIEELRKRAAAQARYAEAEPLLLAGCERMKTREATIPPQGKDRLPKALDRLIKLDTASDKPDEVQKWRAERATFPCGVRQQVTAMGGHSADHRISRLD